MNKRISCGWHSEWNSLFVNESAIVKAKDRMTLQHKIWQLTNMLDLKGELRSVPYSTLVQG
jgi:hypothetical protein